MCSFKPLINKFSVIHIEFIVFQNEVLLPRRVLCKVFIRIKIVQSIRPHRESWQSLNLYILDKLIPKVYKIFHIWRYTILIYICNLVIILKNGVNRARNHLLLCESERRYFANILANTHNVNTLTMLRNTNIVRTEYYRLW